MQEMDYRAEAMNGLKFRINSFTGVFQNAVNKGVRNISFGDLSGNLGRTMYEILFITLAGWFRNNKYQYNLISWYKFKFQIPSYFSLVIRRIRIFNSKATSLKLTIISFSLYQEGVFRIDRLESLLTEGAFVREILLQEFAKEVNYANSGENKNASVEEVSLVLYQMTSAQEILPILSVIPEVRMI
ncbi:hypothetical protein BHE74_00012039 [Ensete ventricosum]|nr:hypothetical protein GW17_00011697 [Ensete ventricosum]RWW79656.1 hypothetical protein BHE74_00012039 [Ensete ventricosum]RZR75947.1 hypothetical protein BHM03_00000532 [Ensete ventricosum]